MSFEKIYSPATAGAIRKLEKGIAARTAEVLSRPDLRMDYAMRDPLLVDMNKELARVKSLAIPVDYEIETETGRI